MARSYHSLPDEIVKEIITPRLSVPEDLFRDNSLAASPFSTPSPHPCSNILVVCKQWMRVATPLLYHVVILRSTAQAASLARALKKNPDFGKYVLKLRLEGGFGLAVEKVLRLTPNVKQLAISLIIWSHDNVSGLVNSLDVIQPRSLFLTDGVIDTGNRCSTPDNAHTKKLTDKLCECLVRKWKRLVYCDFPYNDSSEYKGGRVRGRTVAKALAASLSIQIVSMPYDFFFRHVEVISRAKNLRHIRVKVNKRPSREYDGSIHVPWGHTELKSDATLKKLVRFEREHSMSPAAAENSSTISHELNPFYSPLANVSVDVRERIWSRIIMFASDIVQLPKEARKSDDGDLSILVPLSRMRFQIALVCKLFYRLAESHLYRDPGIYNTRHLTAFASTLDSRPSLAEHIQNLGVPVYNALWDSDDGFDETEQALKQILERAKNLIDFQQINGRFDICCGDWNWAVIDSFQGTKMVRLNGLRVKAPTTKAGYLSLAKFENLTELELYGEGGSFGCDERNPEFPIRCLSRLEKLICSENVPTPSYSRREGQPIWRTSLLDVLVDLELPSLRSFTMKNSMMRYLEFGSRSETDASSPIPPDFVAFVTKHGPKLVYMELGSLGDPWSPFPHCPNLKEVKLAVGTSPPSIGFFDCGRDKKHPSLQKMSFMYLNEKRCYSGHLLWPKFFDEVNFQAFSSIELHIPNCHWPTNDREIKLGKNAWAQRSEMLKKEYNIRLMDGDGVQWVPRLGSRGRAKA